jgi:hypothetical protein
VIRGEVTPIRPEIIIDEIRERTRARLALEQEQREARKRERLEKLRASGYKRKETNRQQAWRRFWEAAAIIEQVKHTPIEGKPEQPVVLAEPEADDHARDVFAAIAARQKVRAAELEAGRREARELALGPGHWEEVAVVGRFPPQKTRRWVPDGGGCHGNG